VREWLKPVQRRGSSRNAGAAGSPPTALHARRPGWWRDVLGKYIPTADQAVYDALVTDGADLLQPSPAAGMATGKLRLESMDESAESAMRYQRESGWPRSPNEGLLDESAADTVDFARISTPSRGAHVLAGPAALPVCQRLTHCRGMATQPFRPHNLAEVVEALIA